MKDVVNDLAEDLTDWSPKAVFQKLAIPVGTTVGAVCVMAGGGLVVCTVAGYATKRAVKAGIGYVWDRHGLPNHWGAPSIPGLDLPRISLPDLPLTIAAAQWC